MLAARQRLRRRRDFTAAVRSGRRVVRGTVVMHLARGDGEVTRVGFVIPRAVGGAVTRNQLRRRLRHLIRERLGALPPGSDLVVRAREGAASRSYHDLGRDLDAALATKGGSRGGGGRAGGTRMVRG